MILVVPTDLCVQILFQNTLKAELSLGEGGESSHQSF